MEWGTDLISYIPWIAVIIILFVPSSKSKKVKELEGRIIKLEKRMNEDKK